MTHDEVAQLWQRILKLTDPFRPTAEMLKVMEAIQTQADHYARQIAPYAQAAHDAIAPHLKAMNEVLARVDPELLEALAESAKVYARPSAEIPKALVPEFRLRHLDAPRAPNPVLPWSSLLREPVIEVEDRSKQGSEKDALDPLSLIKIKN